MFDKFETVKKDVSSLLENKIRQIIFHSRQKLDVHDNLAKFVAQSWTGPGGPTIDPLTYICKLSEYGSFEVILVLVVIVTAWLSLLLLLW